MPNLMNSLKAVWIVQAGIIPMEPVDRFTKRFEYDSIDADFDERSNPGGIHVEYHSRLAKRRAEAMDYYLLVSLPQLNNWATITFIWY